MTEPNAIQQRVKNIRNQLRHFAASPLVFSVVEEVEKHLAKIISIEARALDTQEQESHQAKCHPLGPDPFLTAKMLFHLDRCEELLKVLDGNASQLGDKTNTRERLLYPTMGEAIILRLFSFLVHIRGCLLGYETNCQSPTLREMLYLKGPYWLEPFLRRFLPNK